MIRHIHRCNSFVGGGAWHRLRLDATPVGWVRSDIASFLQDFGGTLAGDTVGVDLAGLHRAARHLAEAGLITDRQEAFDIRADNDGRVLGTIDRGALWTFGLQIHNAHLNALVRRPDGLHLWVSRRAAHKAVAPGKLDHLVAGGIPAGLSPRQTLVKEAAEEAGLPAELVASAIAVSRISYAMPWQNGVRRETMHCFDVELPETFMPHPVDGESAGFTLWPLADVIDAVRQTDEFMDDVNLALIDLALRHDLLRDAEATELREALSDEPPILACVLN